MKSKSNVLALKGEKEQKEPLLSSDRLKWFAASTILLAGLIINHYYSEISQPIRWMSSLATLAGVGFVASLTSQGRWVMALFRDARMELRKAVWPTREETMQTTFVVAAMVVILALILWGIDGLLVWVIGLLAGHTIS